MGSECRHLFRPQAAVRLPENVEVRGKDQPCGSVCCSSRGVSTSKCRVASRLLQLLLAMLQRRAGGRAALRGGHAHPLHPHCYSHHRHYHLPFAAAGAVRKPSVTLLLLLAAAVLCLTSPPLLPGAAALRLTFPPARDYNDGIDSVNYAAPCGVYRSADSPITPLAAGTTLNVTWSLSMAAPGGYKLELLRPLK